MTVLSDAVTCPVMAKKSEEPTEQVNFRFKKSTVKRMRAYAEAQHLHPTLTMVAEAAVLRYLDDEEPKLESEKHRRK